MRLREEDVRVEYLRASGPGGQHRNKSLTGVRLYHRPTRTQATATERRSRARNLEVAWRRLEERVADKLRPRKKRVPTRPTRASRRRRLENKKRTGRTKALRRSPRDDD